MNTPELFPPATPPDTARTVMNGKPVYSVPAKSVINFKSGFGHKLLCDDLTFTTGSACAYSCAFCYVPDMMRKSPHRKDVSEPHEDVVIRRQGAIAALRDQLTDRHGRPRFADPSDNRVIYSSPLVDVAANMDLVRETIEACKAILELTHWQIRLLSKSNLLPKVAEGIVASQGSSISHRGLPWKSRVVFGVSTGTLDDSLAKAFEAGTPLVSKRIASLHWLQDNGFRTYGMICPSLPQADYGHFAQEMAKAVRVDRCEHVWGEVINVRGDSMTRTINALRSAGFTGEAAALEHVSADKPAWEAYARATFEAQSALFPKKLRFLQYVTKDSRPWWADRQDRGAILL